MIRKVQIIFVSKTSRLWKIFTAFAYADIIGSTYIACRNKFLTKNKNISRTSRNVLLLLLCAKTTIVICSKEQLLAMIFVTDNLVYRIYISSKFIANFHDVSRNLDRYSCRMKFPRYIEILTNDFWQCSFLLSVNLTLFFFLKFRKIITRSNHLQRRKPILFHDLLKLVYETNFIRVEIFEVLLTRHYGFKDIAFNTAREHWCKYHKIK